MTRLYPDLGSASDWLCRVGNLIQPIRSTTQIWVMTGHQYRISTFVSQMSFGEETSGSVAKCRLFSQANSLGQGDVFKHELWSERFRLLGKFYCANSYHIDDINCSDKKNKTLPNLSKY